MKLSGEIIRVDEEGRIVIPIALRRKIGIMGENQVEITIEDGMIVLRKADPTCSFCDANGELQQVNSLYYCINCVGDLIK
jgi:AbrB family transcriptional regulator, transcriptional pleiotropic regulator of transition state genes